MAKILGSIASQKAGSWKFSFGKSNLQDKTTNPNYRFKNFYVGGPNGYGSSEAAEAAAIKYRESIQPQLKKLSGIGKSKVDNFYKSNIKFQNWFKEYAKNSNNPIYGKGSAEDFYALGTEGSKKVALKNSYENGLKNPMKKGYNTTVAKAAEQLGTSVKRLTDKSSSDRFGKYINKFESTRVAVPGKIGAVVYYKDFTKTQIDNFKKAFSSDRKTFSAKVEQRVKEIDNVFRDTIVKNKKLPPIKQVLLNTSANTSSEAATAMNAYSQLLRGEGVRGDLGIKENIEAGNRLLTQFGKGKRNTYASEFYKTALKNIDDKNYGGKGTLKNFRKRFNKSLRLEMGLTSNAKLPFNVNEVISISAGESRGIQPFSVFVDATNAKINSGELANYQGSFSKKVGQVEDLIKAVL